MAYDKYIVYFISRTKHKMTQFIQAQLKAEGLEELIPSHGNILTALYESPTPLSMREIAKKIGKDKSTVTSLIHKLQHLGYIEKQQSSEDKRVTYIQLSEKGKRSKLAFDRISQEVYQRAYHQFTPEDKATFLRLLKQVNDNFTPED